MGQHTLGSFHRRHVRVKRPYGPLSLWHSWCAGARMLRSNAGRASGPMGILRAGPILLLDTRSSGSRRGRLDGLRLGELVVKEVLSLREA